MRGLIGPWSLEEVYCGNPQLTFVTAILYALRLVLSRKMRRGRGRGKERPGRAPAASNWQENTIEVRPTHLTFAAT